MWGFKFHQSPYLASETRLADVIAAIQATGIYKFYKLDFAGWARRISGDEGQTARWEKVFKEHPEFFRLDTEQARASLVVRRQRQRCYDVDADQVISKADAKARPDDRISRVPLTPDETETLVNVAIGLHAAALERQRARRWWLPLIAAFAGALAGGLLPRIISVGPGPSGQATQLDSNRTPAPAKRP